MRKLFVAFFVIIAMTSCNSFKINVNLDNSSGKTVSLQKYEGAELQTLNSAVAENNKLVFKVKKSDNLDAYHIMMDGWRRPLPFFAENQNVTIIGDYQKYNGIIVEASEMQKKLDEFVSNANQIEDEKELHYFVLDFMKQNNDNPLGVYVMYRYKWAFSEIEMKNYLDCVPADLQSGYKDLVVKYIKALQRTNPGQQYIDFTQKDVNGNDFTMSKFIGDAKVIILDFWASWCPDCRKENPGLVAVYNKFKNKGLDIVSVSLDTNEEAWKNAIEKDNLSWKNHVSDLKGWNNAIASEYTIAFIPQNLILDQTGRIIEKNMPMEKMEDFLASILK